MIISISILLAVAVVIPFCMGAGIATFVEKQERNYGFMFLSGYILYFALFHIVAVPMIIKQTGLSKLCIVFVVVAAALGVTGIVLWIVRLRKFQVTAKNTAPDKLRMVLWICFVAGVFVQLLLSVFWAYGDGDDAYYVVAANEAVTYDKMYLNIPYTGMGTPLNMRYALAPFPMVLAFWAKVSGLHVATIAHVVAPVILIPLTYTAYALIGSHMLVGFKRYLPGFLIFVQAVILWGNYSLYTAETFLMTRSRQGKAALGNLVIPMCFLLVIKIAERLSESRKVEMGLWALLLATSTMACLCSTLGGFLSVVLMGVFGVCALMVYKKISIILPLIVCSIPPCIYLVLYMLMA